MDQTEYRLAFQIGQRAFYAIVSLVVLPDPSSDSLTIAPLDSLQIDNKYFTEAIKEGITFAWQQACSIDPSFRGMEIRNIHVRYQAVDSTRETIGYAAAGAVLRAIGQEHLLPTFHPDKSLEKIFGWPVKKYATPSVPDAKQKRNRNWLGRITDWIRGQP